MGTSSGERDDDFSGLTSAEAGAAGVVPAPASGGTGAVDARVARAAAVISVVAIITAPLTFARLERLPGLSETADVVKL